MTRRNAASCWVSAREKVRNNCWFAMCEHGGGGGGGGGALLNKHVPVKF